MVGAARARPHRAVPAGAERASDGAAGGHDPASVLRRAELARDAAVHAAARPRSRRPAHQGGGGLLMRVAIGLRLEANEDWAQAATYVTEAERLGVDFVWSHESWGLDAATPLAFMAARTSRIRLGSGIMQAATLSPRGLELTGEIADGWLGTSFMPDHARIFFDHIEAGAKRAGRSLAALDLQAGGAVAFGDDVERLLAARKPGLAFTLGAMGSREHNFYNDAFKRAGYADAAIEVQRLWLEGKRDEAAARVPDELALKANLLGTEKMVRERLGVYRAAGITTLRVDPAGPTLDARLATRGRRMARV